LHSILFRPEEGQGLLFRPKFLPPGYLETPLLERYSKCSIQKVHASDYFLNNSRTKRDNDLKFSLLGRRDSRIWKYAQIWMVYLLTDRILA
jgi:hypothetical protein